MKLEMIKELSSKVKNCINDFEIYISIDRVLQAQKRLFNGIKEPSFFNFDV